MSEVSGANSIDEILSEYHHVGLRPHIERIKNNVSETLLKGRTQILDDLVRVVFDELSNQTIHRLLDTLLCQLFCERTTGLSAIA
jgi:hypothetical protein